MGRTPAPRPDGAAGGSENLHVHNKKEIQNLPLDADMVIFGHSHKYFEQVVDGKLWLNPGSCGKRRFGQEISFAVLTIDGESYQVQKIVLPQA